MKRIIAAITAASIMGCGFSCSEKKESRPDSSTAPESSISVTVPDVTVSGTSSDEETGGTQVQKFTEYKEDDFSTIEVSCNVMNGEPPLTMNTKNMEDFGLGKRIPSCKDEKYRDLYKPYTDKDLEDYDEIEEAWENSFTEPLQGMLQDAFIDGNTIYAVINYDMLCTGSHELSVFRINEAENEVSEIFRHSDPENSLSIRGVYAVNGEVYVITSEDAYSSEKEICRIDEEKGELVPMLKDDTGSHSGKNIIEILGINADRLIVEFTEEDTKPVDSDYKPKNNEVMETLDTGENVLHMGDTYSLAEYDPGTKQWKELYSAYESMNGDDDVVGTKEFPLFCGELFAWKEKPERTRKYDVVTEKYRVSTGLTNCEVVYASEDRLVVSAGSSKYSSGMLYNGTQSFDSKVLHVFDLKKKEHYILDYTSLGSGICMFSDGSLIVTSDTFSDKAFYKTYYVRPENGLAFQLKETSFDSDFTSICMYKAEKNSLLCFTSYMKSKDGDIDKIDLKALTSVLIWYTKEEKDE